MRPPLLAALLAAGALACGAPTPSGPASSAPPAPSAPAPSASTSPSASGSAPAPAQHTPVFGPLAGIYLGGAHLCAVETNGAVRCVGDWPIPFRESGARNQGFRSPIVVENLLGPLSIALGTNRGCAVMPDGSVWCWGNTTPTAFNWTGAEAGKLAAAQVDGVRNARQVALGWSGSCALRRDGKISCWGPSFAPAPRSDAIVPPPRLLKLAGVTSIAAQGKHACAVHQGGKVACWGDDTMAEAAKRPPGEEHIRAIDGIRDAQKITAGDAHDCVVTQTGEVLCWGVNGNGQLGDGTFEARSRPVKVVGLSDVVDVAAGHGFTCALTREGAVACWGNASNCVLGDSPEGCTKRSMNATTGPVELTLCPTPQVIPGTPLAIEIAVGSGSACARTDSGTVYCWGRSLTESPGSCSAQPL